MPEQWIQWKPIAKLASKYQTEAILDKIGKFTIILSDINDNNKKTHIIFEESVDIYRVTQNQFRQHTLHELTEKYESHFWKDWTFFKVKNSSYIQWLSKETIFTEYIPFIHFSFITSNFLIEVIDPCEPKIEVITTTNTNR